MIEGMKELVESLKRDQDELERIRSWWTALSDEEIAAIIAELQHRKLEEKECD